MADDHPLRAEVLRLRARARVDRYQVEPGLADAIESEELAQVAGDDRAIGEALLVKGDALQHRGAFAEALEALSRAKAHFAAVDHRAGCAEAERLQGMVHLFGGDFVAADGSLRRAYDLFEQVDDQRGMAWALQNLSWSAYIAGRVDEAEQRVTAAMAMFEELGDPGGLTWSRGLLAWVRFHQGRNDEALELATAVGEDARQRGERWGEAMMRVLSASISLWCGRTDDAVESARDAVALFEEIDDQIGELQARCGLGRALLMSGQVEAGITELQDALADGQGPHGEEQAWMARVSMLMSSVQLGDVELGASALADSQGFAEADSVGFGDRVGALAIHHLQRGELAEAAAVLQDDVEPRGYVQCARALLFAVQGDLDATQCAADELAVVPHTYLDRAYAEVGRAIALAGADRAGEARTVLAATIAELDDTGDRLAQAVVRLVDASVAEQGRRLDAATARSVAESRLQDLGVHAGGWRHLLQDALGLVATA